MKKGYPICSCKTFHLNKSYLCPSS